MGNSVQTNKFVSNVDIPILIGHCAANPYGGYSGGYKMLVTGLAGRKSIESHHGPKTMHRKDWLGGTIHSHMRRQFKSIGENIEKTICRAYDDFELVASAYCKIDDNRKKQFCGCVSQQCPDLFRTNSWEFWTNYGPELPNK